MGKQNVHAIVGTGTVPARAIKAALKDAIEEGDAVNVVWEGDPEDHSGQETVLIYLLDNEVEFTMYYAEGENPPDEFRKSDHGTVQKVRNPHKDAVKGVDGARGKILFLWNNDEDDSQIDFVFDHKADDVQVYDLTNGLTPISADVEIPEPKAADVQKDEDEEDDTRFTKEELETMTAVGVKRYGARIGAKGTTKSAIIAELFPDDEEDEAAETVAEEPEKDTTPAPPVTPGDEQLAKLLLSLTNVTPSKSQIAAIEELREAAKNYAVALFKLAPHSRERSLAATHLEDSVMWGVKSIVLS